MELLTLRLSSSVSPLQRLPRVLTLLSTGSIFWCLTFSVCNRAVREKGGFKLLICLGDTEYWIEGFTKCKNYNMPIPLSLQEREERGKTSILLFMSASSLPPWACSTLQHFSQSEINILQIFIVSHCDTAGKCHV